MSLPVERDAAAIASASTLPAAPGAVAAPGVGPDADFDPGLRLPNDHPPWARDVVSLSARARALVARVKPAVIRVVAAWEHRVRTILVGGRRLSVDASGCYRVG
ncbi:MAG: hypothetical protein GIW95_07690 [Candidatus Eremiobacteraeota bacterium]|nr:hypothetical protein [Candidatus Eremiobacteraeota bacterium]